jgi:hypothetical protein
LKLLRKEKMSNVIGPIRQDDWYTMVMLRYSIKVLKERNKNGKFDIAITKEKEIYKEILRNYT